MNLPLDDQGHDGLDSDESALRRLLHEAVQEVEPRSGALDHLRRAVPARRARKRQALVGAAAAVLLAGTAVPALLHVSRAGGTTADPAMAGQASETRGAVGDVKGPEGGPSDKVDTPAGGDGGRGKDGSTRSDDPGKAVGSTSGSPGGGPSAPSAISASTCTASQLGQSSATVAVPDAAGIVYGTFRVVNVSDSTCTVGGSASVTPAALGAADGTKITVAQHASGDAAAGLPDPSLYVAQLSLAPGSAYDVKFAWVPSETCPTTGGPGGGDPTGSPDPSPSAPGEGTTGTTGGTTGESPQLVTDGTADGSVLVTYTAEGGSPTVSATVADACAGTVYRTGVLASS